mgnify:CR=1 FL=1
MTESEWLTTHDVGAMLRHLEDTGKTPPHLRLRSWLIDSTTNIDADALRDIVGNPFRSAAN